MPFFSTAKKCAFDDIEFPIRRLEVIGGLRDHIHEPPHSDGGIPEKMGRKLYVIRVSAIFDEGIQVPFNALGGPSPTYPDILGLLRDAFERGVTRDLVLPNLGTIKAYCRNWPQTFDAAVLSGETAEFEFVEDPQVSNAGVFVLADVPTASALFTELDTFNEEAAAEQARQDVALANPIPGGGIDLSQASNVDPTLLSSFAAVFQEIIALRSAADFAGVVLDAFVASLLAKAELIDDAITAPVDYPLLYAVQEMVVSAQRFQANAQATIGVIANFVVPQYMTVLEVSNAIFGDTSHAMDILQMNPIADAYRIAPQTNIAYINATKDAGSAPLGGTRPFVLLSA